MSSGQDWPWQTWLVLEDVEKSLVSFRLAHVIQAVGQSQGVVHALDMRVTGVP